MAAACTHEWDAKCKERGELQCLTWSQAPLLQNSGRDKERFLGVRQELVCVPSSLRVACIGVDVAQLTVCGCQLHRD